nr:protein tilB homolog [Penaeus vannamei]
MRFAFDVSLMKGCINIAIVIVSYGSRISMLRPKALGLPPHNIISPPVTVELVRKRAEHNEGELSTLEEISLHQQDIEKIEHLHRWCPRLRILYLQGNLIAKIENLGRLRELEYLNLALNNIEVIEGLERCESLRKLDLTANFVSELTSILSLQDLPNLKELFLTGNPCTGFRGYRPWVICALPGLEELDGEVITRAQRIRSVPPASSPRRPPPQRQPPPRSRVRLQGGRAAAMPCVLEVHTYKYLDASQVQCDVEPWYVRVSIRGKVLQLVLLEEVRPGQSTAQRSQVTGHLLVTMPKSTRYKFISKRSP